MHKGLLKTSRVAVPWWAWVVVALAGLLNYMPIFVVPEFLNDVYYHSGPALLCGSLVGLSLLLLLAENKRMGLMTLMVCFAVLAASGWIRKIDNKFVVWYNLEVSDPNRIKSPILGYKKILPSQSSDNMHDVPFEAMLKFNDRFGTYEALVFQKGHELDESSFDGDDSLCKVYNEDWWWYRKMD